MVGYREISLSLTTAASIATRIAPRPRRSVGVQVPHRVLGASEEHREHARIPEQIGVVTQRGIEDAPLALLSDPGDGVIVVVAEAPPVAPSLLFVDRSGIDGHQNPQALA